MVVANHPLCIGCYALLQQTENARAEAANDHLRLLLAQQNHLAAEMDWMLGLPSSSPKVNIPVKTAPQYNTFHHVNVEGGSTVGAITTGSARSIAVAIGNTEKQGNTELAAALKAFTDALASEPVTDEQKRAMSEQLANAFRGVDETKRSSSPRRHRTDAGWAEQGRGHLEWAPLFMGKATSVAHAGA